MNQNLHIIMNTVVKITLVAAVVFGFAWTLVQLGALTDKPIPQSVTQSEH